MADVFVIVQQDGAYSDKDWKIISVCNDFQIAKIIGWKSLISETLKPWKIKFYQDRKAKYAAVIGIPDYHIEEWDHDKSILVKTWFLGWQKNDGYKYTNYMDEYLKKNNKSLVETLEEWKVMLDDDKIPEFLDEMIFH